VIFVDWQEYGFVPLSEHGTLYLGRAFGEAVWTAFDLWPLRVGDGIEARSERQKAWGDGASRRRQTSQVTPSDGATPISEVRAEDADRPNPDVADTGKSELLIYGRARRNESDLLIDGRGR
jgi:hypothetical protein